MIKATKAVACNGSTILWPIDSATHGVTIANREFRSGSPAMTQKGGIEIGQSSSYSVHAHVSARPDHMVVSNPAMKVQIQERNNQSNFVKRNSEINSLNLNQTNKGGGAFSGLETVSVNDAKLELLSQPNAMPKNENYPQYSQFANPFSKCCLLQIELIQRNGQKNIFLNFYSSCLDVQSFHTQNVRNTKVAGPQNQDNGIIRQAIQASETESQKKNPTKVEVYKVYDLIKGGEGGGGPGSNNPHPRTFANTKYTSKEKLKRCDLRSKLSLYKGKQES